MDSQEELKAHLMATDEEYRRLATEHSGYAKSWMIWRRFRICQWKKRSKSIG